MQEGTARLGEHGTERGRKVKKALQTDTEFPYYLKEVARNKIIMFRRVPFMYFPKQSVVVNSVVNPSYQS